MASAAQFFVVVERRHRPLDRAVATLSGMMAAVIMNGHDGRILPALLAAIGIGFGVGLVNGLW